MGSPCLEVSREFLDVASGLGTRRGSGTACTLGLGGLFQRDLSWHSQRPWLNCQTASLRLPVNPWRAGPALQGPSELSHSPVPAALLAPFPVPINVTAARSLLQLLRPVRGCPSALHPLRSRLPPLPRPPCPHGAAAGTWMCRGRPGASPARNTLSMAPAAAAAPARSRLQPWVTPASSGAPRRRRGPARPSRSGGAEREPRGRNEGREGPTEPIPAPHGAAAPSGNPGEGVREGKVPPSPSRLPLAPHGPQGAAAPGKE